MSAQLPKTLFVGESLSAVTWYRVALPAMALGCDWIAAARPGSHLHGGVGVVEGGGTLVEAADYEVIVVQLASGRQWLRQILDWRAQGITVLYDVDDWLRGVRRNRDHDFRQTVDRERVESHEVCMAACDGVICSTAWLARRYRKVNPATYMCRNGIDLKRYALTRPARADVAIGWSGATGHGTSVREWLSAVKTVMRDQPATRFVSVGQGFADELVPEFGASRALAVPFTTLDTYPATMTLFDVALAPAGKGSFFKGKSDLRWLEASALGIPVIADPDVYPDIEHGVTGFHATTAADVEAILRELVADPALRDRVGAAAKAHVTEHRRIEVAAQQWARLLTELRAPEPVPA